MSPLPNPTPPTVDDLAYLTELSAPVETLSTRMSRTPTFLENTVKQATEIKQRTPRERINAQAW